MSLTSQELKKKKARCQNLVKEYGDILLEFVSEIKRDADGPILGTTADEIALNYKYKEGIKYGSAMMITKLTKYASE